MSEWGFATRIRCSDGKRHPVFFISAGERPPTVLADGSFSRSSRTRRGAARVSGQFDQSGNAVTGIYNVATRSKRYTCRTGA